MITPHASTSFRKSKKELTKRRSMAAMKQSISDDTTRRTSGFVSDVVPKVSDVWFRYEESQMQHRRHILSVITITSIDELQNSVNGLDGMVYPSSQTTPDNPSHAFRVSR